MAKNASVQFYDSVHQCDIELPKICSLIINTRHFQRLKNLKQLGGVYFIFPTASHNRYEHSIGTAHLAGEYGRILQKNCSNQIEITDDEIICLEIAGLCHDLGHGPLSHAWEGMMNKNNSGVANSKKYKHEDISCQLFQHMLKSYPEIEANLPKINSELETIEVIIDMIQGISIQTVIDGRNVYYRKKYFLFQIISNAITGIDVDKFDYLLRDSRVIGISSRIHHTYIMNNTNVQEIPNGFKILTYRNTTSPYLRNIFNSRVLIHQIANTDPTNVLSELMILDSITMVQDEFKIHSATSSMTIRQLGEQLLIGEENDSALEAFLNVTDTLIDLIKQKYYQTFRDASESMVKAAELLNRVDNGDIYKFIGYWSPAGPVEDEKCSLQRILVKLENTFGLGNPSLKYHKKKVGFGVPGNATEVEQQQSRHPLNEVVYYSEYEEDPDHTKKPSIAKEVDGKVTVKYLLYADSLTDEIVERIRSFMESKEYGELAF